MPTPPIDPSRLADLPAALALEVDALCDDFERHWRRTRRLGTPAPDIESFLARAAFPARDALRGCLEELERELRHGLALPDIPGLTLEEEIGRGGMGVVYRARRPDGRVVALKLIPGAERARWTRWLAELVGLRHPNLVPLEDFGSHAGLHFVVMPLVPGGDLGERIASRTIDQLSVARLMAKVARAVAFLHQQGILHRDLKPSNILLADAAGWEPLVCDFGLAGRLDESAGGVMGTPAYMAPEQRAGRPLTVAADLWSLGAVLGELLTGRPPQDALTFAAANFALERICRRCLAPEPQDRYATAEELAGDLLRFLDEQPLFSPGNNP